MFVHMIIQHFSTLYFISLTTEAEYMLYRSYSADSPSTTTETPGVMSDIDSPPPQDTTHPKRPGGFSDGPNARSKTITMADGDDTFGVSHTIFNSSSHFILSSQSLLKIVGRVLRVYLGFESSSSSIKIP